MVSERGTAMPGSMIPAGYAPPFATVSSSDHTAWLLIATSLGVVYSCVFVAIRTFVCFATGRGYGLDDGLLILSTAIAVAQSSLILKACSQGLGKTAVDVAPRNHEEISRLIYGGSLLFIAALGLSKVSVETLVLQLIPDRAHRRRHHAVIALMAAWTIASLLAIALCDDLSQPWSDVAQASTNVLLRWQIIGAFDILSEVAIVFGVVELVWRLQTHWTNKATVIASFSFRLIMIVFVALRLATHDVASRTADPTLSQVPFLIWTEVELHWSLVSATIPCLRPVVLKLATNYGALGPAESSVGYASDQSRTTSTGRVAPESLGLPSKDTEGHAAREKQRLRPAKDESKRITISKEVSWTVAYDTTE